MSHTRFTKFAVSGSALKASPALRASLAGAVVLALTTVMTPAFAQGAVPPKANVTDRDMRLSAASILRAGPRLIDRPVATPGKAITVRGAGRCDDASCPVAYDGKTLWARRTRLEFGTVESVAAAPKPPGPLAKVVEAIKGGPGKAAPGRTRLERGDKGEDVARLQEALTKAGVFKGAVDGNFGRGTRAAVEDYQKANKLKVDGVVGRETLKLLGIS